MVTVTNKKVQTTRRAMMVRGKCLPDHVCWTSPEVFDSYYEDRNYTKDFGFGPKMNENLLKEIYGK